jgi:neprilysin
MCNPQNFPLSDLHLHRTPTIRKSHLSLNIHVNSFHFSCDDFYAYSCNQWIKNNPIPDGKSMWGTFGKLEQQNQLVLKNVLERNYTEMKSEAEKKAKRYFESCMDTDEIMEKLGAKPMVQLLNDVGGWNVTGSEFNITKWSLQKILQKLHNTYNMGGLFGWAVGEDDRNSSKHIIQIDQGGLTLPTRDNYINKTAQHEKILIAYHEYMTKVAILLGATDENDTRRQMKEVIDFETRLAEITIPNEERRDEESLYNLMTLTDLQDLAPFISWRDHFEDAFRLVGRKIGEKEKVVVYAPTYLKNLTILINNYTRSSEGKM